MRRYNTCIVLFVIFFLFYSIIIASAQEKVPRAVLQETQYDFGTVTRGVKVQSTIPLRNDGDADLIIREMSLSLPAITVKAKSVIPPGNETKIALELDTAGLTGDVQGDVILLTNDPHTLQLLFHIQGHVQSLVDILPRPAIFLSAFRWEVKDKESSIYLVNNDKKPLKIIDMKSEGDKFTPKLETIEEGQRYELSIKLNPNSPSGMDQSQITVSTENEKIIIPVYTFLKEKVYVNPPSLDFGRINLEHLEKNSKLLTFLTQSVFVYKHHGQDFQIEIQASPQFLSIQRTPPQGPAAVIDIPKQGKTAVIELAVTPIKEKLKKGRFEASIRVSTNDKEFPVLEIPVYGEVI